ERSSQASRARNTVHSSQLWGRLVYSALPITERIHEQELSIPMNQMVTEEEAKAVVEAINSFK
ncbi:MAG: DegT/DnrJ/EryC1/StrS family aminotransferase, partial [Prevotella sp.]|nr:DegT/DnrJ/EryC1/StrS family aminotransferase [Prevotella sp.]